MGQGTPSPLHRNGSDAGELTLSEATPLSDVKNRSARRSLRHSGLFGLRDLGHGQIMDLAVACRKTD